MEPKNSFYFSTPQDKLIIALDNVNSLSEVHKLIEVTSPYASWYKAGLETLTAFGSNKMARIIKSHGRKLMNDGKYHDIPNTVGNATGKLSSLYAEMMTLHCCNGIRALKEAVAKKGDIITLGVTVLTSHSEEECQDIFGGSVNDTVLKFARYALEAGLDGIVCSAKDLEMLSEYPEFGSLYKITPGIQPVSMAGNDQRRTKTPAEAIKLGASALVVGRAITGSKNPGEAAKMIMEEIGEAMVAV